MLYTVLAVVVAFFHSNHIFHPLSHGLQVTCVKLSADGTTAVSGSDDKVLIVWETKRGLALTSLQLHVPFIRFDISLECSRILVHIVDSPMLPVICLHNTPASYIKLPTYSAPAQDEGKCCGGCNIVLQLFVICCNVRSCSMLLIKWSALPVQLI